MDLLIMLVLQRFYLLQLLFGIQLVNLLGRISVTRQQCPQLSLVRKSEKYRL